MPNQAFAASAPHHPLSRDGMRLTPGGLGRPSRGVMTVSADEYPVPPQLVGRGAVFVEHRLKIPQVSESAYIAPTAVLAGDVTVGPHSRVLFGAVITAEGGPVEIGRNCVIMENAVIRGVPGQQTRIGDDVLVGPHAHLTGCVIEGRSRIATGATVFNGARVEAAAEIEFNAVVYVNTVVPGGAAVPMGWFAGGHPAELVAPGDWERIRAIMGPLDYAGTVFGIGAGDSGRVMSDAARRYARGLALHHQDHVVPDERHVPVGDGVSLATRRVQWYGRCGIGASLSCWSMSTRIASPSIVHA
jgi:gamma-carbonic anhydrase